MASRQCALARWRSHLEEVVGVDDAAEVVDPFADVAWDQLVTGDQLRAELADLRAEMHVGFQELRRDLLKVAGAQFFALITAVAALVAVG